MRKLTKVVGVIGGIAAVAWAMRDRLISIAAPREPEPPTFRVVPPRQTDDLTNINGIGPVFAARLLQAGIRTFADLAQADPAGVAETAGVAVTRASEWIEQASARV